MDAKPLYIAEHSVLVVLEDGTRFYTAHALVDADGAVLPIEPLTRLVEDG